MSASIFIKYLLLAVLAIIYLIFTIKYTKNISRNILFSRKLKIFHIVMIWIVPFLWFFLLKNFTKTAPGSYEIEEKREHEPFSSPYNNGE